MNEDTSKKGTYAFVSLGCPKNLVDSEKMLGTLALDGYTLVSEPDGADFVIVNTCGFIEQSRAGVDRRHPARCSTSSGRARRKGVIVAGCLAERVGGGAARRDAGDRPPRRRLRPR